MLFLSLNFYCYHNSILMCLLFRYRIILICVTSVVPCFHVFLCIMCSGNATVGMLQASIYDYLSIILFLIAYLCILLDAIRSSFQSRHTKFKFNYNPTLIHYQTWSRLLASQSQFILFHFISFELLFQLRYRRIPYDLFVKTPQLL